MLCEAASGWTRGKAPKNVVATVLSTKRGGEAGEDHLLPCSWVDVKLPRSVFLPSGRGSSLFPYMVKLGLSRCHGNEQKAVTYTSKYGKSSQSSQDNITSSLQPPMCTEKHVLGIITLLSPGDRMWLSCHHCFIVWEHVSCFCGILLLEQACLV